MNIDKMIEQWEEKHSSLLDEYSKGNANNEVMQMYRNQMKNVLDFINQLKQVKNCFIPDVSVSLRDYIATECMKSEIISWNKEMSNEFRAKLLEDMIERYGNIKINDAIALISYEMADAMLSARSNER